MLNSERIGEQLVEQLIQLPSGFGTEMALMVDLQGPKLRLGTFKDVAAEIDTGQDFTLDGIVRLDRSEYFQCGSCTRLASRGAASACRSVAVSPRLL